MKRDTRSTNDCDTKPWTPVRISGDRLSPCLPITPASSAMDRTARTILLVQQIRVAREGWVSTIDRTHSSTCGPGAVPRPWISSSSATSVHSCIFLLSCSTWSPHAFVFTVRNSLKNSRQPCCKLPICESTLHEPDIAIMDRKQHRNSSGTTLVGCVLTTSQAHKIAHLTTVISGGKIASLPNSANISKVFETRLVWEPVCEVYMDKK
mmetsp:Transcript_5149/g.7842  ORF Transcript_5149/g.7842 Transcript_5149/m.7842 type:complete len:208 (+) Transcript_5149:2500-3123(+)